MCILNSSELVCHLYGNRNRTSNSNSIRCIVFVHNDFDLPCWPFSISFSLSKSLIIIHHERGEEVSDNNLSSGWRWEYFPAMEILSGLLFPFWILLSANWLEISISWKCKSILGDRKKGFHLVCCCCFLYSLSISFYVFISHWVLSKYLHSYFVFAMVSSANWCGLHTFWHCVCVCVWPLCVPYPLME